MIPAQELIDNLDAQDIIDASESEIEELEELRKEQIRKGCR